VNDRTVAQLLDDIASADPTPGGGPVAGVVTAFAAALVTMGARATPGWDDAEGVAAQAAVLRRRALELAEADEAVHAKAAGALAERGDDFLLGQALHDAADVPVLLAATAADVGELAAGAADQVSPDRRPDLVAAAALAEGAARSAAHLVAANLAVSGDDPRPAAVTADVARAEAARSGL
jgi:formiminotetrahydrofolate cyclodeaminase